MIQHSLIIHASMIFNIALQRRTSTKLVSRIIIPARTFVQKVVGDFAKERVRQGLRQNIGPVVV
jgi:predicted transcriptional regulator